MEHGKLRRDFFKYTTQNIIGMIGLSCYILADTYFVSVGLGPDGLAALNLAIPFYSFLQGTGLMLGMGGATQFSFLRRRGMEKEAQAVFTQSVVLALVCSVIFLIPGLLFAPQISTLLGGTGAVHEMTAAYLQVQLSFSPIFLLNNVILCFVRNDGSPRRSMLAMLGGSLSNILLDYIFIFLFHWGMFGASFATCLAPMISLLILCPHFQRRSLYLVRSGVRARGAGRLAALGTPSLIGEVSSGLVLILYNYIMLRLAGTIGVAGYGVVANIYLVVLALFTGLGQGIQPLVSSLYGQGSQAGCRQVLRYAIVTAAVLASAVFITVVWTAEPLALAFNQGGDPVLQQIAVRGLRLCFSAFFFAGLNIALSVYFASVDQPKKGFIVSILRGFILIVPLALLMSGLWGMDGVWLSALAAEAVTACVAFALYRSGK